MVPARRRRPGSSTSLPAKLLEQRLLPRLRTLTNYGIISVQNAAYFGSAAQPLLGLCEPWQRAGRRAVRSGPPTSRTPAWWMPARAPSISPPPRRCSATASSTPPSTILSLTSGSLFISNQVLNAGHSLTDLGHQFLERRRPGQRQCLDGRRRPGIQSAFRAARRQPPGHDDHRHCPGLDLSGQPVGRTGPSGPSRRATATTPPWDG